jgi:hypothetical protein
VPRYETTNLGKKFTTYLGKYVRNGQLVSGHFKAEADAALVDDREKAGGRAIEISTGN